MKVGFGVKLNFAFDVNWAKRTPAVKIEDRLIAEHPKANILTCLEIENRMSFVVVETRIRKLSVTSDMA